MYLLVHEVLLICMYVLLHHFFFSFSLFLSLILKRLFVFAKKEAFVFLFLCLVFILHVLGFQVEDEGKSRFQPIFRRHLDEEQHITRRKAYSSEVMKVASGEDSVHQRQRLPMMMCLDVWCIVTTMVMRGSFHNVPEDSKGLVYQLSGNPKVTSGLGSWAFYVLGCQLCWIAYAMLFSGTGHRFVSRLRLSGWGPKKKKYTHKSLFSYGVLKLVGAELIRTHIWHWVRFNRASFILAWLGSAKTSPLGLSK